MRTRPCPGETHGNATARKDGPGIRSDGVITSPSTSFRRQFRVVDALKALAERAGRELLAAGDTVRKRTVKTAGELVPREAQVARLACDERVNPDIGTRRFIGPRQAGWHLRKVQSPKSPGLRSFGHAYPGRPEQVQRVRADLGAILDGCPVADETILAASELAANAVTHSRSRQAGGQFIVRAEVSPGDYVRVEVEDQGESWAGHHP